MSNMWKLLTQDCSNRLGPLEINYSKLGEPSNKIDSLTTSAVEGEKIIFQKILSVSAICLPYQLSAKLYDLSVTKTVITSPASCKNAIDARAAAGSIFVEELFT